jgi:glycerol uptake facilitator-like aquaporin
VIGTYILAFFGCGSVMSAVITGAQVGLWQVAEPWSSSCARPWVC